MADIIQIYYEKLLEAAFSPVGKIKVRSDFYGQMNQINKVLNNDYTALISSLLEFQIEACNVPLTFDTDNENYTNVFNQWQKDINIDLNIDIPQGLRSFTEQYFRERFTSSFIVLKGKWGRINDIWMPTKMWIMDGASIYPVNDGSGFNTTRYYFGKPLADGSNEIKITDNEFVIVRKPYNKWTDLTPTPYLVKVGALFHALLKSTILSRQVDIAGTTFPLGFFIKMGCEEAMRNKTMPTADDLKEMEKKFQNKRTEFNTHPYNKGLIGAFPFDVSFENLIPDYIKALDEKILKGTDKNILSAMGMIEFKGFSSNREEAILNPKVMVQRCEDAVLDYVELHEKIVSLIKQKNGLDHKKTSNIDVRIHPGIIKSFVDDKMRAMIRNWYDRGLVAKQDAIENTTPLNFETQVNRRKLERQNKLNEICYPPVVMNQEQYPNDSSEPTNDNVPLDKKKGTPESKNYKNATMDGYVTCENCESEIAYDDEPEAGMGYIKCPICEINIDQTGKSYQEENVEYLEAPYKNVTELPPKVKDNMTKQLQRIFMNVVNNALKNGDTEEVAFTKAWGVIVKLAVKGKNGKWRIKKSV